MADGDVAFAAVMLFLALLVMALIGLLAREFGRRRQAEARLGLVTGQIDAMAKGRAETLEAELRRHQATRSTLSARDAFLDIVLEASPIGILTLDVEGYVLMLNRRAAQILGADRSVVVGSLLADADRPGGRSLAGMLAPVLAGSTPSGPLFGEWTDEGQAHQVEVACGPLRLPDGVVAAHVVIVQDVTARFQTEAELRQAQKMEIVGQLSGGFAHDLNNLLTAIIGNLDLALEDDTLSDATRDAAGIALEASLRGADLNQQLLAYSRRQVLQSRLVDINAVVLAAVRILRRGLGEAVELHTNLLPGTLMCNVDPSQLQSAIMNLAINARDALEGGGRITIETARRDLGGAGEADGLSGPFAVITVSDNGTGIPPELIERVIEPFFTTKDVGVGSGLGLSMVHGFANQSGGRLHIYSELGLGTTIRIFLPAEAEGADALAASDGRDTLDSQAVGNGERILVVENDQNVRKMVIRQLGSLGYRTLEAEGGEAAMAALVSDPDIDLVFTDVVLPGTVKSRDVVMRCRNARPPIPVVLTSGFSIAMVGDLTGIHELPLLPKPYRRHDLALAIQSGLGRSDGAAALAERSTAIPS